MAAESSRQRAWDQAAELVRAALSVDGPRASLRVKSMPREELDDTAMVLAWGVADCLRQVLEQTGEAIPVHVTFGETVLTWTPRDQRLDAAHWAGQEAAVTGQARRNPYRADAPDELEQEMAARWEAGWVAGSPA